MESVPAQEGEVLPCVAAFLMPSAARGAHQVALNATRGLYIVEMTVQSKHALAIYVTRCL